MAARPFAVLRHHRRTLQLLMSAYLRTTLGRGRVEPAQRLRRPGAGANATARRRSEPQSPHHRSRANRARQHDHRRARARAGVGALDTHVQADHITALGLLNQRFKARTVLSERSGAVCAEGPHKCSGGPRSGSPAGLLPRSCGPPAERGAPKAATDDAKKRFGTPSGGEWLHSVRAGVAKRGVGSRRRRRGWRFRRAKHMLATTARSFSARGDESSRKKTPQ
jgi:hypothetical protein